MVFTTSRRKSSAPLCGEPVPPGLLLGAKLSPALGTKLCLCINQAGRSTRGLHRFHPGLQSDLCSPAAHPALPCPFQLGQPQRSHTQANPSSVPDCSSRTLSLKAPEAEGLCIGKSLLGALCIIPTGHGSSWILHHVGACPRLGELLSAGLGEDGVTMAMPTSCVPACSVLGAQAPLQLCCLQCNCFFHHL